MAKHHTYSIEFKRQVAQEYIAGETLHALAKRHDVSRNLIRIWVAKYEAGTFEDDAQLLIFCESTKRRLPRSNAWSDGRRSRSNF